MQLVPKAGFRCRSPWPGLSLLYLLVPLEMKENTTSRQPSSPLKLSISPPLMEKVHRCYPLNRKISLPFISKELPSEGRRVLHGPNTAPTQTVGKLCDPSASVWWTAPELLGRKQQPLHLCSQWTAGHAPQFSAQTMTSTRQEKVLRSHIQGWRTELCGFLEQKLWLI